MTHSSEKVFMITLQADDSFPLTARMQFGIERIIANLAKKSDEIIHFHQFKDTAMKVPAVLLECSEAFIENVKAQPEFQPRGMPNFVVSGAFSPDTLTIRRSSLPQVEVPEMTNNSSRKKGPNP